MSICLQDGKVQSVTSGYKKTNVDLAENASDTFITFEDIDYHFLFEGDIADRHVTVSIYKGKDGVEFDSFITYIREGKFHYKFSEKVGLGLNLISLELLEIYRVDIT